MAEKQVIHTTPRGVFKYPRLNVADTKFKPEGEYSVKLIIPEAEAAGLISLISEAGDAAHQHYHDLAKKEKKKPPQKAKYPFEYEEDLDTGELTGRVVFKFSTLASGVSAKTGKAWQRRPIMFDAAQKPIDLDAVSVWSGSEGKVAFIIYSYTSLNGAGVSLKIQATQLLKLVSGGNSGEAADFGFDAEEGYAEDVIEEGAEGTDEPLNADF